MRRKKEFSQKNIAIIGGSGGVMGKAIAAALARKKILPAEQILVTGPREEFGRKMQEKHGVLFSTENEVAAKCDIIVIAVKPPDVPAVLRDLQGRLEPDALVISIAAGVSMRTISRGLNGLGRPKFRNVVRCMPNTPGRIGKGITGWTAKDLDEEQLACTRKIIGVLGREKFFKDEKILHLVTALSGSAPAYLLLFMEAMVDAAVREGMSRKDALELVLVTAEGTAVLAQKCRKHLAELRNEVTSSGGTTAAALYEMEKGGLRTIIADAIRAALEKSIKLGEAEEKEEEDKKDEDE